MYVNSMIGIGVARNGSRDLLPGSRFDTNAAWKKTGGSASECANVVKRPEKVGWTP
jgi:hypothetical protein